MAFTTFEEHDWTTNDVITAALMDALEKRAAGARASMKASRTTDLSIASTTTSVTFDTEVYDNDSMFTAGDSDIEIQLTGIYHVLFTAAWSASTSPSSTNYTELEISEFNDPHYVELARNTTQDVQNHPAIWWNQVSYVGRIEDSTILHCRASAPAFTGILENNAGGVAGDSIWATVTMLARDPLAV